MLCLAAVIWYGGTYLVVYGPSAAKGPEARAERAKIVFSEAGSNQTTKLEQIAGEPLLFLRWGVDFTP